MASLTHISIWDDRHGWQHTTVQSASDLFPYTVSASEKAFLCELCGQYATLTKQGRQTSPLRKPTDRHFRHTVGEKYCEEKTTSYNSYYITNPRGFSLPLRVKVSNGAIDISIGFLPIAENFIQTLSKINGKLIIKANNKELRQYNIDVSRFSAEHIAYLSVGNNISKEYQIVYPDMVKRLNMFWPTLVDGIDKQGTLFDYESGKRLPRNANVVVGKVYLLFLDGRMYPPLPNDITINKIDNVGSFKIYEVCAKCISHPADEFFRRYNCRLTDNPAVLTLLYPFALKSSHVYTHTSDKVWFHKTNGFVEVYPQSYVPDTDIFAVNGGLQQLLSVSRFENNTSVLRYTMLRKVQSISREPKAIHISVCNNQGKAIEAAVYNVLPPNREIHIVPEYDGFVEIVKNSDVVNRTIIKNGIKSIIDVEYGGIYRVYQGLDCVYQVEYTYKKNNWLLTDDELLAKLQRYKYEPIPITHSFVVIAERMNNFPKTNLWLRKQIANGKISRYAERVLHKLMRSE